MALHTKLEILSLEHLTRVHEASLEILKHTGVVFKCPEALEIFRKNGARVENDTVFLDPRMVESAIEQAPSTFHWEARNPDHAVTLGKGFAVQPNGGVVDIQDEDRGRRPALLEDFANIQKLCQASEVVSLVGSFPVEPRDVSPEEKHLQVTYAVLKHTDKPVISYCSYKRQVNQMMDMVEIAMGGRGYLENHYAVAVSINPLSPLKFSTDAAESMLAFARRRQPVLVLSCVMAGVSGPIHPLGVVVQQNAEILAGLTLVQLVTPGNPVVYCPASTAANMKIASYVTGPPEAFLINTANLQLALDLYHLPTRTMCGMTDSKRVDCQAGYETMQNLMMGMLSGAHIIHECLGVLDSIMCTSYEKFIIDEELISRVMRISRGLEFTPEALSLDIIRDVDHGGDYLLHDSTFTHARDFWAPTVSVWEPFGTWEKQGREDALTRANHRYRAILEKAPDSLLDAALEADLQTYMRHALKP